MFSCRAGIALLVDYPFLVLYEKHLWHLYHLSGCFTSFLGGEHKGTLEEEEAGDAWISSFGYQIVACDLVG